MARQLHKAAVQITRVAQSTLDVGSLWEQFDLCREDVAADSRGFTAGVVTVTGALTLMTAGYVTWPIRGGYLLTCLLASLPAWHMMDPLPILTAPRDPQRKPNRANENAPDKPDDSLTTSGVDPTVAV